MLEYVIFALSFIEDRATSEASSGAAGLRLELFGSDLEKQGESGILAAGVC
jgi:hypothetical protein